MSSNDLEDDADEGEPAPDPEDQGELPPVKYDLSLVPIESLIRELYDRHDAVLLVLTKNLGAIHGPENGEKLWYKTLFKGTPWSAIGLAEQAKQDIHEYSG